LKDELGDLLLQVLFYAQMASEAGYFDIGDVAANLNAKLVRRHPHVFPVEGKLADATDADAVLRNWEQIKRGERWRLRRTEKNTADASASSGVLRRRAWMRFRAPCRRRWRLEAGLARSEGGLRLAGARRDLREATGRDRGIKSRTEGPGLKRSRRALKRSLAICSLPR
jgi:hypothetical protein